MRTGRRLSGLSLPVEGFDRGLFAALRGNDDGGVYAAFYDDYNKLNAFLHSHSFTGNPLVCRSTLATLAIFEQDGVVENNRRLAAAIANAAAPLKGHPHVAEVRQTGMILTIELSPDGSRRTAYPWQERRGLTIYRHALGRGVLLRPLGNVVYFMPPYVIDEQQIAILGRVASEDIDIATGART